MKRILFLFLIFYSISFGMKNVYCPNHELHFKFIDEYNLSMVNTRTGLGYTVTRDTGSNLIQHRLVKHYGLGDEIFSVANYYGKYIIDTKVVEEKKYEKLLKKIENIRVDMVNKYYRCVHEDFTDRKDTRYLE